MIHKDVLLHFIGEMASYVLESKPQRMVISLHIEKDGLHLCIIDTTKRTDEELEKLRKDLNPDKRPELAEYYGQLAGSAMVGEGRLNLVGLQIKCGTVTKRPEGTMIDLWIGSDRFDPELFSIPKKDTDS